MWGCEDVDSVLIRGLEMGVIENNITFSLTELIIAETGGKSFEFSWLGNLTCIHINWPQWF